MRQPVGPPACRTAPSLPLGRLGQRLSLSEPLSQLSSGRGADRSQHLLSLGDRVDVGVGARVGGRRA